ncbi:dynamin family protein [Brachybacterium sp. EF45031]|uniref:dynamin family protein n=1 Tax=Brachybacterium sillae TaxID=2810536 RepID=UPI00217F17D2|nr:dynamin family protein [Brachybacterium sillae]MCS6711319.1 dynamin family protein [Brachybacterium sillae]
MSTLSAGSDALDRLAADLDHVELPLPVDGVDTGRAAVSAARTQIVDHVAPRLDSLDAPLLVVIGGSTGAGKSTLVNSLLGRVVSRAGAIRPTTRRPLLLHHPEDAAWFDGARILPGLARVRAGGEAERADVSDAPATSLELVSDGGIPRGIALLDAPDIDSVSSGNRELARQLLRAADLWLFVTTANRYADAVPWEVLRTAAARDVTVAVVMNRIPPRPGVAEELSADLRTYLDREGLEASRLFLVEESDVDDLGLLAPERVREIREFLDQLAGDADGRGAIARRTLAGALDSLAGSAEEIALARESQERTRDALAAEVDDAFAQARRRIEQVLGDGSLLRGEVLARWQDVVGTGDVFRGLESFVGRVRDGIGRALRGEPAPAAAAEAALESGLVHVVVDESARGAEQAETAWQATPAGRSLLEGVDLSRIPESFRADVAAEVRAWQGDVLALVREEGADRRLRARVLSLGVNTLAVALMVVVFVSTAFIPTGLEVGAGAATAIAGQRLLEAIFGEDAVRRLAKIAKDRLATRLDRLVAQRSAPFHERLDVVAGGTTAEELRADAADLRDLAGSIRAQARRALSDETATGETATDETATEETR